MIIVAVTIALMVFAICMVLNLYRITVGPGAAERIVALDTLAINGIALLVLYGILEGTKVYFEASMLFAMVGFASSVALCRFLLRGDVIE